MQDRLALAMPDDNSTLRVTAASAKRDARRGGWRAGVARSLRGRRLVRMRSSIGMRLALLTLALGLPVVVYVAVRQASIARDYAQQRTLALARVVAARVDDVVGDNLIALALVRHGVTLDPSATRANDAFLDRIRGDLPGMVQNVGVWTRDGRNVGMLNRTAACSPARSSAQRVPSPAWSPFPPTSSRCAGCWTSVAPCRRERSSRS